MATTGAVLETSPVQLLPARYRKKPTWKRHGTRKLPMGVLEGTFDPTSTCVTVGDLAAVNELQRHGFGSNRSSAVATVTSSQEQSPSSENTRASNDMGQEHSLLPDGEFPESQSSEGLLPEAKRLKHDIVSVGCTSQHTYGLSLAEAFYLSYEIGAFTVYSPSGLTMDHLELWRAFLGVDRGHPVRYAVYRYLRTNGWIPRCGLKFGVEYLAYREGVEQYHSSYCVKVREVSQVCVSSVGPGWLEVAALQRVAESTGKNLVIMDVAVPSCTIVDHPSCVQQFTIQETLVKRWNYTRDRLTIGPDID